MLIYQITKRIDLNLYLNIMLIFKLKVHLNLIHLKMDFNDLYIYI